MHEDALGGVALVIVAGVGAMLVARWIRVPSILALLATGVALGPGVGWLDPRALFGPLLFPAVSLGVGLLLFEGGLGLRWAGLAGTRSVVVRLVTLGVLVTWGVGALAGVLTLDLDHDLAVLLAAVLVVSGPTVVLPLVKQIRVRAPLDQVLRWEGITIDAIGATLAIVVLEGVLAGEGRPVTTALAMGATALVGTAVGGVATAALVVVLRRHLIPDDLQVPVTLMAVVGAFAAANHLQPEAGLFATTVFGVALANQRWTPVRHIAEFSEHVGSVVLGAVFIVLGATVDLGAVRSALLPGLAFTAVLVLVARPLAVAVSTAGTGLARTERLFLCCLAPRGIVAASVASLFGLRLADAGRDGQTLVSVAFVVVFATAVLYGTAAPLMARRLGVQRPEPRGVAIVGAPRWAALLADELRRQRVPVLVVSRSGDADDDEGGSAPVLPRAVAPPGIEHYDGPLAGPQMGAAFERLGIRQAITLAADPDHAAHDVAVLAHHVGRANVFHLSPPDEAPGAVTAVDEHVRPRLAFPDDVPSNVAMASLVARGARFVGLGPDDAPAPGDIPVVVIDRAGRPCLVDRRQPPPVHTPGCRTIVLRRSPSPR